GVMKSLGPEGQSLWSRLLFFLVSTDGRRLQQTASDVCKLSQQPPKEVEPLLQSLLHTHVLRSAYRSTSSPEPYYEVSDDTTAGALLEWHSQFVAQQIRAVSDVPAPSPQVIKPAVP